MGTYRAAVSAPARATTGRAKNKTLLTLSGVISSFASSLVKSARGWNQRGPNPVLEARHQFAVDPFISQAADQQEQPAREQQQCNQWVYAEVIHCCRLYSMPYWRNSSQDRSGCLPAAVDRDHRPVVAGEARVDPGQASSAYPPVSPHRHADHRSPVAQAGRAHLDPVGSIPYRCS